MLKLGIVGLSEGDKAYLKLKSVAQAAQILRKEYQ